MANQEMLINYVPGEECRIAIVEDGRLEEFYQERVGAELHVSNIYKGRVVGVEPSIQAAFIDFGLDRNGFLHITDLHPMYFPGQWKEESERVGQKTPHRDRPPIQSCLRRGQEILVQVLKEGIGTKGPTLTSYLSIPGRFLVMMPHMHRLGVSRRVEDEDARREMRKILDELKPPEGFGFIIRTAGMGRPKAELKRDLAYLHRLWKAMEVRRKQTPNVGELYTESDLIIRTIRDVFGSQIKRIIVDHADAARRARNFLAVANPRSGCEVMVYQDPIPLFHRYDIERQIENINAREVPLPSGGSLVIDSAEALVAIDVNSGKNRESRDAETTAYKTNIEATDEVCRQLRLRDLGGVVAIDLIDMRHTRHRRDIEQRFRNHLKNDRARTRVLPISQFGLLEMTRQRMRPSLKKSIYIDCPGCGGMGQVKSPESVVLDVVRRLSLTLHRPDVARVELTVSPDAAFVLLNQKRTQLVELEKTYEKKVIVRVGGHSVDFINLSAFDSQNKPINIDSINVAGKPTLEPIDSFTEPSGVDLKTTEPAKEQGDVLEPVDPSSSSDRPTQEANPEADGTLDSPSNGSSRRRRRRRGGRRRKKATNAESQTKSPDHDTDAPPPASSDQSEMPSGTGPYKLTEVTAEAPQPSETSISESRDDKPSSASRPRRRRRRSGRKKTSDEKSANQTTDHEEQAAASEGKNLAQPQPDETVSDDAPTSTTVKKKKRSRSARRPRKRTSSQPDESTHRADDPPSPVTVTVDASAATSDVVGS